jgi:hypothetical protein
MKDHNEMYHMDYKDARIQALKDKSDGSETSRRGLLSSAALATAGTGSEMCMNAINLAAKVGDLLRTLQTQVQAAPPVRAISLGGLRTRRNRDDGLQDRRRSENIFRMNLA